MNFTFCCFVFSVHKMNMRRRFTHQSDDRQQYNEFSFLCLNYFFLNFKDSKKINLMRLNEKLFRYKWSLSFVKDITFLKINFM